MITPLESLLLNQAIYKTLTSAFVLLSSASCSNIEEVSSVDIETSKMWGSYEVYSDTPNLTTVKAALLVGGSHSNTYIEIHEEDVLKARLNGGSEQILALDINSPQTKYIATFEQTNAGLNSTYDFLFIRSTKQSATSSRVKLPSPVSNIQLNPETSFSRNLEDLIITWDKIDNDRVTVKITGDCIKSPYTTLVEDQDHIVIPAGELVNSNTTNSDTCTTTLQLSRTNDGKIDPAFKEGGEISATTLRAVTIESRP